MKAILFLLLFTSSVSLYGQIRKTKWGMTKQQVIASEGTLKPVLNQQSNLVYNTQLAGREVSLFYSFNKEGKLYCVGYFLDEKYVSENSYLKDFYIFSENLDKKYGESKLKYDWSNNLYRDDSQKWGLAIGAEHLEISSTWHTDDTYIKSKIEGKNFKISVYILYYSKEFLEKTEDDLSAF